MAVFKCLFFILLQKVQFLIHKKCQISKTHFDSMVQKGVDEMIEVVNDKERNLKNLKQIGTPRQENKIYIENITYNKIKEDSYKEKRVFVLMGHTERMEGRYATFIEAAIPVRDIEFSGTIPRWDNSTWSEVFREIKRLYEDIIIVGWAIDIKGMSPKMTPDLERVHREHFGGVHQLLFLLDTLEQEETFYMYKENKLVQKDGFYIYHKARRKENSVTRTVQEPIPVTVLPETGRGFRKVQPEAEVELTVAESEIRKGGKYRQLMQEQKKPEKDNGNLGVAVAVAMLVFVIGVGVYENSGAIFGKQNSIETNLLQKEESTQSSGEATNAPDTETSGNIIEVEVISGTE